ncbi:hypothetical protein [Capnocytophaga sputigena]|uniref:Uncharacterized protein n=1 Tax=Capnocytophaga sputigena TaxID=1019 RepID=A0AAX2IBX1_CAPSP|nr:hypothetical protein [Capnocytophaga sputigena]ATA83766.1 hypothetical protein CGC55_04240 [Capnocytophaga sputigena]SQA75298.1 Uncharacterised protein [Capnocytophaga sputigena]
METTTDFLERVSISDWISIIGIIINSSLSIWLVITIQNRLTNKRVLKDHFITEIKDIRSEYKIFLNNLYSNNTRVKSVIPWFKLMNIKVIDIMRTINEIYKIDENILNPYQNELRELITENEDFISSFNLEQNIIFSDNSKTKIIEFQQKNNSLFNRLIIEINKG